MLARIPERELVALEGYGWRPIVVSGFDSEDSAHVHRRLAAAMDEALDEISAIQTAARTGGELTRPTWPMLILRTEGLDRAEGGRRERTSRAAGARTRCRWPRSGTTLHTSACSRTGCGATDLEELFDEDGRLVPELAAPAPEGERRMSANPQTNGGTLLRDLVLPDFRDYAVEVTAPATGTSEATRVLGGFLRDIVTQNPHTVLRPRRDRLEPARRRLLRHRPHLASANREDGDDRPRPGRAGDGDPLRAPCWAGWRVTCSPAGTVSSTATRPSSTSSTRCSTSTRSG